MPNDRRDAAPKDANLDFVRFGVSDDAVRFADGAGGRNDAQVRRERSKPGGARRLQVRVEHIARHSNDEDLGLAISGADPLPRHVGVVGEHRHLAPDFALDELVELSAAKRGQLELTEHGPLRRNATTACMRAPPRKPVDAISAVPAAVGSRTTPSSTSRAAAGRVRAVRCGRARPASSAPRGRGSRGSAPAAGGASGRSSLRSGVAAGRGAAAGVACFVKALKAISARATPFSPMVIVPSAAYSAGSVRRMSARKAITCDGVPSTAMRRPCTSYMPLSNFAVAGFGREMPLTARPAACEWTTRSVAVASEPGSMAGAFEAACAEATSARAPVELRPQSISRNRRQRQQRLRVGKPALRVCLVTPRVVRAASTDVKATANAAATRPTSTRFDSWNEWPLPLITDRRRARVSSTATMPPSRRYYPATSRATTLRLPVIECTSYVAAGTLRPIVPDVAVSTPTSSWYVPAAASEKSAPYGEAPLNGCSPPGRVHGAPAASSAIQTPPEFTVTWDESVPALAGRNRVARVASTALPGGVLGLDGARARHQPNLRRRERRAVHGSGKRLQHRRIEASVGRQLGVRQ